MPSQFLILLCSLKSHVTADPSRPTPGPSGYDMVAALMLLQRYERGIHAF
jgi:hypothetical protein